MDCSLRLTHDESRGKVLTDDEQIMGMPIKSFAVAWLLVFALGTEASAALSVAQLRCDYRDAPPGIDNPHPQLSWELASATRGQRQTAYQILVASREDGLLTETPDLWNSRKVLSDDTQIEYAGKPLASGQTCYWIVRVFDENGYPSVSEVGRWTMGLLRAEDWQAKWIGAEEQAGVKPAQPAPLPIFRVSFVVHKPVTRALVYLCGLGQQELHLNGHKVGDDFLEPGWTNYRKTCLYVTYDVGAELKQGENVLGVMLGNGMYNVEGPRYTKFKGSFGPPKLIAQIEIDYADGSRQQLLSDHSWKWTPGPITFSSI